MTPPLWATPKTRLFLVAYEGSDGRPYALALSDHGVAARLARRLSGEVIDTMVDNHAHMAADVDADSGETECKGGSDENLHCRGDVARLKNTRT